MYRKTQRCAEEYRSKRMRKQNADTEQSDHYKQYCRTNILRDIIKPGNGALDG